MNNTALIFSLVLTLPIGLTGCGPSEQPTEPATERSDEHAQGSVQLTNEQIRSSGIGLQQTKAGAIRETLAIYGTVAPNAERVREVTARYPGIVRSVAKRVGDSVREGETLAMVESNESLRTYPVTAPLTGVIIQRKANSGEYTADAVMFTVADLSSVWVELSIFPRDVAKVRVGQTAYVKSPDAGLNGEGKVVYVAPFGQAANQTVTARVLLNNEDRRWAPGLYVTAEVTLGETRAAIVIRNEAIQTLEGRPVVFVHSARGFDPVDVTLGRHDGEFTEVTSGLVPGQTYATTNSFILKAELGKGAAGHED